MTRHIWCMHSPLRPDADRRKLTLRIRSGIADDLVLSAVAMMEDAIEDVLRIEDLASRLNVSSDKLERAFKAELGVSPNSYYRNLRLGHALPYILRRKYVLGYDAIWLRLKRSKAMADR